jgi:Protein of unknown function (DUF2490)
LRNLILILLYVVFLLAESITLSGQQKDFMSQVGLFATHNVNRSWDVSLGLQIMNNQNLAEVRMANLDFGLGYQITPRLKTELHYRPIKFRTLDNDYENRSLFYHTLTYGQSVGRFYFSVRNRLQQLVYGDHFNDSFKGPLWYNRNKFSLKYKINYYWSILSGVETFQPLNHPTRKKMDQIRSSGGLQYNFNDHYRIEVWYTIMQQINRPGNNIYYLATLNFNYKF